MTATAKPGDPAIRKTLRAGWLLLAIALPFGVTLETLHGFKVQAYLASEMRREMWRLAHAHGTLLGILCLVSAALAEAHVPPAIRPRVTAMAVAAAAVCFLAPTRAAALFVLQAPPSWAEQDGQGNPQKTAPCGQADPQIAALPTNTVTTFRPGQTITVTVDERTFHPGHY